MSYDEHERRIKRLELKLIDIGMRTWVLLLNVLIAYAVLFALASDDVCAADSWHPPMSAPEAQGGDR